MVDKRRFATSQSVLVAAISSWRRRALAEPNPMIVMTAWARCRLLRALDQQRAQVRIAATADRAQPRMPATGVLSRYDAEPGGQLPAVPELPCVAQPDSETRVFPTCVGVFPSSRFPSRLSTRLPHVRGGVSRSPCPRRSAHRRRAQRVVLVMVITPRTGQR
jgi:hypothetical protein